MKRNQKKTKENLSNSPARNRPKFAELVSENFIQANRNQYRIIGNNCQHGNHKGIKSMKKLAQGATVYG